MQSNHNTSAIIQARPKPTVDQFSEKALVDYQSFLSVDEMGNTMPLLLKTNV
jgi:hypothetical protein